jgi:hypothetical protein
MWLLVTLLTRSTSAVIGAVGIGTVDALLLAGIVPQRRGADRRFSTR